MNYLGALCDSRSDETASEGRRLVDRDDRVATSGSNGENRERCGEGSSGGCRGTRVGEWRKDCKQCECQQEYRFHFSSPYVLRAVSFTPALGPTFDLGRFFYEHTPSIGVDSKDFRLLVALHENARQS